MVIRLKTETVKVGSGNGLQPIADVPSQGNQQTDVKKEGESVPPGNTIQNKI